jgi:hypothetical protein
MDTPKQLETVAPVQTASVPVKVNAAALAEALSKMAATSQDSGEPTMVNPAAYIGVAGNRIPALYSQFSDLQLLASKLNGLPLNEPPPAHLHLNVKLEFATSLSDDHTTSILLSRVRQVADIVPLINNELSRVLLALQKELAELQPVAAAAQTSVEKALTNWLQRPTAPDANTVSLNDETKSV